MLSSFPHPGWLILAAILAAVGALALWQTEPRVALLWLNTALLAAGAALVALPLGSLAAVLIYKTDVSARRFAAVLFVAMLFVPLYIVAGAWDAGFGLQGWYTLGASSEAPREPWLAGWRAAIWIHGLAAVPWVVLIVGAGLRAVEAEIEEDAATCAAPFRVLWYVTLRRAAPAFMVAFLWIAVVCAAEISVTDFFQVRTFAEEVYTQAALGSFDGNAESGVAAGFAPRVLRPTGLALGLILSAGLALLAMLAAGQFIADCLEAPHRPPWVCRLGGGRGAAALLLAAILLLVAGVPLANLLNKAGMIAAITEDGPVRYWSLLKVGSVLAGTPAEFRADLALSARIGAAAATAAVILALPLAWGMRGARLPWIRLTVLAFCLTIPGPLLGVGLIRLMNQPPESPLAAVAWLYDTNFAPWLVQTLRALPLAVLILWPALASVPQAMLDAAATEGSGWWGRLLRIAVPQRWSAVAAAWFVGLAVAVGELAATILVVPPQRASPIAVRVFQLLHYGTDDRVAAISLVMVAGIAALTAIALALLKHKT